ncbi:MAG TPA: DUF4249 domain-containing protein [Chitinophagaceae bacterium]|nr:DUF4249 domain-containing protein [Chitinophagaceae bacterium]
MRKILLPFLACTMILAACEKDIRFKLDQSAPRLVVDASIENGMAPVVVLSRSLDYFSQIDPAILQASFVHGATVTLSDGTRSQQLREYSRDAGGGYTLFYYTSDSSNPAGSFVGALKHQYELTIVTEGQQYQATTTIPDTTKRIDSVYWKAAPPGLPPGKVALMVRLTDPPGYGDYMRYFTRANQEPFYPGINSVFDDQIIDGTTYDVQVDRGFPRNLAGKNDSLVYFSRGDTVTLKLCRIDKATFDFWRTMEYSYASIGNPFSSPTQVISNIRPTALGYFGGYAAQYRTLIIPH